MGSKISQFGASSTEVTLFPPPNHIKVRKRQLTSVEQKLDLQKKTQTTPVCGQEQRRADGADRKKGEAGGAERQQTISLFWENVR